MRRSSSGNIFVIFFVLTSLCSAMPIRAIAQGEECPEDLVYLPAEDFCMLEEEVPEGVEFVDQHEDDQVEDDSQDEEEQLDTDVQEDEESLDEEEQQEADVQNEVDFQDEEEQAEDEQTDDMGETDNAEDVVETDEPGEIKNLTLLTYQCPVNWSPATQLLDDSHEVCNVPPVPVMSYSILYEGQSMLEVGVQNDADLAGLLGPNGIPLKAGMWTIQETPQEGLDDPFAFCAIYAADGTQRMDIREFVPGGKLDVLLAEGEELNCEWFSMAEVPEVTGDPNVLPIIGLTLNGWNCPYGTPDSWTEAMLLATCTEKGIAPLEYVASLNGAVVSTQTGPTDDPLVDFQKGIDTRLLGGLWTISTELPEAFDSSYIFCTIVSATGEVSPTVTETFFSFIELDLKPDETGFCHFFNVESEPRTGPALGIRLLLHTCPEGFDKDSGDYTTCTLPLSEPLTFDFIQGGQVMESGTAAIDATQLDLVMQPESGEWVIRPILPPSGIEPGWACFAELATGEKILDIDYISPADGNVGIQAKFGPNHRLVCDVWNYVGTETDVVDETADPNPPEGESDELESTDGVTGSSAITVQRWDCPIPPSTVDRRIRI